MALTPDDVVTKQFQHVRFKDGFDPDEVDDFLDEIVVEWRKALEENAELKTKLAAYESGETSGRFGSRRDSRSRRRGSCCRCRSHSRARLQGPCLRGPRGRSDHGHGRHHRARPAPARRARRRR
ncbi:DivIVA domain-containing protein [Microbacterium murale]|uniref:Cell wall synthesis protein Wag31 n=1 Tax=Microbacterium murale TaxID=1081040 RepID=A0ABU0P4X3_9MICO|nr:DivIVA domain-containing protein [Microbacterium murale]